MTKREMILNMLHEKLKTLDVVVKRNEIAPQKIPASGLVIMRDGKQGVPEILKMLAGRIPEAKPLLTLLSAQGRSRLQFFLHQRFHAVYRHLKHQRQLVIKIFFRRL